MAHTMAVGVSFISFAVIASSSHNTNYFLWKGVTFAQRVAMGNLSVIHYLLDSHERMMEKMVETIPTHQPIFLLTGLQIKIITTYGGEILLERGWD